MIKSWYTLHTQTYHILINCTIIRYLFAFNMHTTSMPLAACIRCYGTLTVPFAATSNKYVLKQMCEYNVDDWVNVCVCAETDRRHIIMRMKLKRWQKEKANLWNFHPLWKNNKRLKFFWCVSMLLHTQKQQHPMCVYHECYEWQIFRDVRWWNAIIYILFCIRASCCHTV